LVSQPTTGEWRWGEKLFESSHFTEKLSKRGEREKMQSLGTSNLLPMTSSQHGRIHNRYLVTTHSPKMKSDAKSTRYCVRLRAISPKPEDDSVNNVASQSAASPTSVLSFLCPLLKFFGVRFRLVQFGNWIEILHRILMQFLISIYSVLSHLCHCAVSRKGENSLCFFAVKQKYAKKFSS
jgi:hypothetical protein